MGYHLVGQCSCGCAADEVPRARGRTVCFVFILYSFCPADSCVHHPACSPSTESHSGGCSNMWPAQRVLSQAFSTQIIGLLDIPGTVGLPQVETAAGEQAIPFLHQSCKGRHAQLQEGIPAEEPAPHNLLSILRVRALPMLSSSHRSQLHTPELHTLTL